MKNLRKIGLIALTLTVLGFANFSGIFTLPHAQAAYCTTTYYAGHWDYYVTYEWGVPHIHEYWVEPWAQEYCW